MVFNMDLLEKYKHYKEIKDIIDERDQIRKFIISVDKTGANEYILFLMNKYLVETMVHNSVNPQMPTSLQENLINAEMFLTNLGFLKISEIEKK